MSKRFKLYRPGKAPTHQLRSAYHVAACAYRQRHAFLHGGYVVFYQGRPCGWTESIETRPNGWLEGCVAVPADPDAVIHVAVGGTAMDGAHRWEDVDR